MKIKEIQHGRFLECPRCGESGTAKKPILEVYFCERCGAKMQIEDLCGMTVELTGVKPRPQGILSDD